MPTKRFYVQNGTGRRRKSVPAQLQQDRRRLRRRFAEHLRPRREHDVDAAGLLAAAAHPDELHLLGSERDHVQQLERAGLGQLANIPTGFEHGWLNLGFGAANYPGAGTGTATVTAPIHQLINANTTVNRWVARRAPATRSRTMACRSSASRSSRSPTVRSRSAAKPVLSNYGGNFVQKGTSLHQLIFGSVMSPRRMIATG